MSSMKDRVANLIARVLGVDASAVASSLPRGEIAEWDSLKHIQVILAVEEEFLVEFSDSEIADARCIDDLVDLVARKVRT
jgi:acyl carrier protein